MATPTVTDANTAEKASYNLETDGTTSKQIRAVGTGK